MTTNEQYQNAVEYVRKAFKSLGMNASEMQVHQTAIRAIQATTTKVRKRSRDGQAEIEKNLAAIRKSRKASKRIKRGLFGITTSV